MLRQNKAYISIYLFLFQIALLSCSGKSEKDFVEGGGIAPSSPSSPATPSPIPPPTPTTVTAEISPTLSKIEAISSATADGVSQANIQVTLLNTDGSAAIGETPTFLATDTGSTNIYVACTATDSTGIALCGLKSTKAEIKTLTLSTPLVLAGSSVAFSSGAADSTKSTASLSTGPLIANGTDEVTVSIQLKDAHENAIDGVIPTISATNTQSRNTTTACSATDSSGNSTCKLKSTFAETKTVALASPTLKSAGSIQFKSAGLDLVVPLEMFDQGISSLNTQARIFSRSRTYLNVDDYDGSPTFSFQIVAHNVNTTNNYSVQLVDQNDIPVASININANTTVSTFYETSFTANLGTGNNYRISLPQTANLNDVVIRRAAILIHQTAATKTKLYFPLMTAIFSGFSASDQIATDTVGSTSYLQAIPAYYSYFVRNNAAYADLSGATPFEFEAIFAASNGASTATVALFEKDSVTPVAGTELSILGTSTSHQFAPIALNEPTFPNDGVFEVRSKANSNQAKLYRAGVWMKLENLTKAEIVHRFTQRRSSTGSVSMVEQRIKATPNDYSNLKVYYEALGSVTTAAGSTLELYDAGSAISGTSGAALSGLNLSLPTTTKTFVRSADILSLLTNGNYYYTRHNVTAGTGDVQSCHMVYEVSQ